MRATPLLLALPAIAAAAEQEPLLNQVKGWFAKASESIVAALPTGVPSVPVSSITKPLAAGASKGAAKGAAKAAALTVERVTLDNYKSVLQPGAATASPGLEEWMVFVTGGNKTCYGLCEHAETAFNASTPLLAASSHAPHLGFLDCETDTVLCNAWAVGAPSIIHMILPQPLPDQSTPATTVRSISVNRTSVTPLEIANIHIKETYKDVQPYEGFWHPFDGPLAQYGLNIPIGYVIWGFSQVPSWAFMIGISFFSRTIM